jgi:PAS domain S-box-containing protein
MALSKEITAQIKDILRKNPQGLSITDIVKIVNINRNTAGRYLENLLVLGQVEMRHFGMAKIYALSQRVPLSAILSISSELVIQLDSSLRIIFANEPFLKFVGADNKILLGKNIEYTPVALIFDESITGFIEKISEGITGKEWSGEIALSTQDIILFCRIAPTVFEDGRKGVSVILEDITKRKQAEKALLESEVKLRSITQNSPDMILLLNPKLEIVFINRTYTQNPDKIRGKLVFDFIPKEFHHTATYCFEHVLKTGELATYGTEYHFASGKTLYFESTVGPVFQDGTVVALVINARDITERKKADNALRESEDRYRKLVNISPDAVIIHQEGKIIFMNPATLKLLGASNRDEIAGRNILDFVYPDFRETVRINIQKDLQNDITPLIELPMHRVDGTPIIVEGRGVKTIIGGKPAIQVALRDITERKRAEEALRESEEKYRTLIDQANDGICIIQDGFVKMYNPRLTEFWGGSVEEIRGRPFTDFIHPDALSEIVDRYNRRMAGKPTPRIYQTMLKRKDGSRFYAELNAGIVSYEGKPADIVIVRDINDRKKAEDTLRESEERLRLILDSTDDLIIMQDPEGRYLYFNSAARYGISSEEMLGSTPYDFLDRESADQMLERLKNVAKTGQSTREETQLVWNGQILWFSDTLSPVRDVNDTITAVLTISQNITERKRAEMALRESEEKYRSLVDRANDVICVIQDGVVKLCNPRLTEFWGGPVEEMLGRPFKHFVHPDAFAEVVNHYNRRMSGESLPSIYETILIRKDGSRSYVEVNAVTISYEGKTADLVIIRDMNERKKGEEALRESEELYRTLAESSNDLIFVIGRDDRVEYANSFAAALLNKPVEQITGSLRTSFFPPDVTVNQKKGLEKVFETGISVRSEGSLTLNDRVYWFDHFLTPLKDPEGKIRSVLGISRDITERKYADTQLQNSEQRFQRLLELSFDAIAIYKNKKIAFLNEKAAKILGAASPQDLIGRSILDIVHPDSIRDVVDRVQKISTDSGAPVPVIPEKFLRVDGITVNVEVMAISFEDNGLPAVQVAFREITSRDIK